MSKDTEKKVVSSENKSKTKKKGNNFFKNVAKFFRECKSEIKKIVWPTPKAVFKNMGVVLVVIVLIGLFVFGLDTGLGSLFGLFMNIANSAV